METPQNKGIGRTYRAGNRADAFTTARYSAKEGLRIGGRRRDSLDGLI